MRLLPVRRALLKGARAVALPTSFVRASFAQPVARVRLKIASRGTWGALHVRWRKTISVSVYCMCEFLMDPGRNTSRILLQAVVRMVMVIVILVEPVAHMVVSIGCQRKMLVSRRVSSGSDLTPLGPALERCGKPWLPLAPPGNARPAPASRGSRRMRRIRHNEASGGGGMLSRA